LSHDWALFCFAGDLTRIEDLLLLFGHCLSDFVHIEFRLLCDFLNGIHGFLLSLLYVLVGLLDELEH